MEKRAASMSNGKSIRELREREGMTQEKLALMSNVDRRTVQRAEKGMPLQIETLASLASALNVRISEIIVSGTNDKDADEISENNVVLLRPIRSGKALLDMIAGSFDGLISCEAEPSAENIELLTAVVSELEKRMPNPWAQPDECEASSLSLHLRAALILGEQLKQLEGHGIVVFGGTYTAQAQIPRYDADDGHMYISTGFPLRQVTICRITVAPDDRDRIPIKVGDMFVPDPPVSEVNGTDELPF